MKFKDKYIPDARKESLDEDFMKNLAEMMENIYDDEDADEYINTRIIHNTNHSSLRLLMKCISAAAVFLIVIAAAVMPEKEKTDFRNETVVTIQTTSDIYETNMSESEKKESYTSAVTTTYKKVTETYIYPTTSYTSETINSLNVTSAVVIPNAVIYTDTNKEDIIEEKTENNSDITSELISSSTFLITDTVQNETETSVVTSKFITETITSDVKITDMDTIFQMLNEYIFRNNYDRLLGAQVFSEHINNIDGVYNKDNTKISVIFKYLPVYDLDLDSKATEDICKFIEQSNIDSSLIVFYPAPKPPAAVDGKINDPEIIAAMLKDFAAEKGYDISLIDKYEYQYGSEMYYGSRIWTTLVVFNSRPVDKPDYTDNDFKEIWDFADQNNINKDFILIRVNGE